MKDIVIIANFCRDFSENDNGRFMYLCKELSKEHKVEIITSDFSHSAKKHKTQLMHHWPFKITFLHEPGYKKNISLRRFASHYMWGKEVEKYLTRREKPDIVYCAVPSLDASLAAAKYCERELVKFIVDIQDLWPEAFHMFFRIPVISSILFAPLRIRADNIYKRADSIFGVSRKYVDRAMSVNKKCTEGHVVYLGTSLKVFDQNKSSTDPIIRKTDDALLLGYCGSLSASYDIHCVLRALKKLADEGQEPPLFIVMGDGAKKVEFEKEASDMGVKAVFLGRLSYDKMCAQLSQCDMVVNPITKGSAATIINKHADYAAAGKPIINTQESIEYRELVEEYNMGINCVNGDYKAVADAIELLTNDVNLRIAMGHNARKCAEEKFDRAKSYRDIVDCIHELT